MVYGHEESDFAIVGLKPANKVAHPALEQSAMGPADAPRNPIDFEATIEATLLDWHKRSRLRQVLAEYRSRWHRPFSAWCVLIFRSRNSPRPFPI